MSSYFSNLFSVRLHYFLYTLKSRVLSIKMPLLIFYQHANAMRGVNIWSDLKNCKKVSTVRYFASVLGNALERQTDGASVSIMNETDYSCRPPPAPA